jgi:nicotinamidase-related amidase
MPLTQLDTTAALIVIDMQKGIAGIPMAIPFPEVAAPTAQLAQAFRDRGLPVVLVNVTGLAPGRTDIGRFKLNFPPDWTDLVPELNQQPADILISKERVGAFLGTLHGLGVTQIFLAGISTSAGVESTARSAYDLGYNVVFAVDAMTDRDPNAHQYSVEKIFPRLGECDTAANILTVLGASPAK